MALTNKTRSEIDAALNSILDKIKNDPDRSNSSDKKRKVFPKKEISNGCGGAIDPSEIQPNSSVDIYLAELDQLIGLSNVKAEVMSLVHTIAINQQRKKMGLSSPEISNHLVFYGNPGTGKTTVARIIAKIYKELEVVSEGQLIETDRAGMVAGYIGQTALKTKQVVSSAIGGVLFIDEAYTLAPPNSGNDFGQEAIDTLLKLMEDNRNNLVVIVAGYPGLMADFIKSNPGLESRFNKYIEFSDYSANELVQIFLMMCKRYDYETSPQLRSILLPFFEEIVKNKPTNFANAREVRNIFEKTIQNQASRLYGKKHTKDEMRTLKVEDFPSITMGKIQSPITM
ncbi:MAG: AAA family ATPase [Clostridia bacterium]|nr:AAA family ATPase [Clostridia bacterium]